MYAAHQGLSNLIVFLDYNRMQIDGYLSSINNPQDPFKKWESFGFYTQQINGHDYQEIIRAVEKAKQQTGKPNMIILNTIKGKGVSKIEKAEVASHSMAITPELLEQALKELD